MEKKDLYTYELPNKRTDPEKNKHQKRIKMLNLLSRNRFIGGKLSGRLGQVYKMYGTTGTSQ